MLIPVLQFGGCCAEAIELYTRAFGATDINIEYYEDAPDNSGITRTEENRRLVMHAGMSIGGGYMFLNDSEDGSEASEIATLTVTFPTKEKVAEAYKLLAEEGGKPVVGLGEQFFCPMYGSVTDRFGVHWQLMLQW